LDARADTSAVIFLLFVGHQLPELDYRGAEGVDVPLLDGLLAQTEETFAFLAVRHDVELGP
jgi:hypothetical protein